MGIHIWVHGSNPADGVAVEVEPHFQPAFQKALRETKSPLTPERVAKMLGGKQGFAPRVTAQLNVRKWDCLFTRSGQTEFLRAGAAPLPRQNEIKDFRQRPKPFTTAGACTG